MNGSLLRIPYRRMRDPCCSLLTAFFLAPLVYRLISAARDWSSFEFGILNCFLPGPHYLALIACRWYRQRSALKEPQVSPRAGPDLH
jgi:hypothetical protein